MLGGEFDERGSEALGGEFCERGEGEDVLVVWTVARRVGPLSRGQAGCCCTSPANPVPVPIPRVLRSPPCDMDYAGGYVLDALLLTPVSSQQGLLHLS